MQKSYLGLLTQCAWPAEVDYTAVTNARALKEKSTMRSQNMCEVYVNTKPINTPQPGRHMCGISIERLKDIHLHMIPHTWNALCDTPT